MTVRDDIKADIKSVCFDKEEGGIEVTYKVADTAGEATITVLPFALPDETDSTYDVTSMEKMGFYVHVDDVAKPEAGDQIISGSVIWTVEKAEGTNFLTWKLRTTRNILPHRT